MDIAKFQQIGAHMLTKHYGLALADSRLADRESVAQYITAGVHPYQVLNEQAEDYHLVRIDKEGFFGSPACTALTEQDEEAAMQALRDNE